VSGMSEADALCRRSTGTGRLRHELGSRPGCSRQTPSHKSEWKGCWAVLHECVGVIMASPERQLHTEKNPSFGGRAYRNRRSIRSSVKAKRHGHRRADIAVMGARVRRSPSNPSKLCQVVSCLLWTPVPRNSFQNAVRHFDGAQLLFPHVCREVHAGPLCPRHGANHKPG
jgi:hypothetical protein